MQKQKLPSLNIKKKKTSNIRKKEKTSEIPSDNSTDFDSSIDNVHREKRVCRIDRCSSRD